MKFFVIFFRSTLISYIMGDGVLITMSAYSAHEVSFGPELASPQLHFHRWDPREYLSGRYTLDYSCNLSGAIPRDRLNQKMDVVLFNSYLNKNNLVTFGDFKANVPECKIDLIGKNDSSVFGWTYQMI